MKNPSKLTQHEDYLRKYLLLILQCLKSCKNTSLDSLHFSIDDGKVIQYYLKDIARRAVLQSASQDECEAMLTSRIGRLITSDKEEWRRTIELVREQHELLTQKEIVEIDTLHQRFKKKSAVIA